MLNTEALEVWQKATKLIFLILFLSSSYAQDSISVPIDTLLLKNDLNFAQRFVLNRLVSWQHKSYGDDELNCQFEPSCSNFMAQSIIQNGAIAGIISGTDRVLRCNSHALEHHLQHDVATFYFDGRLVEPVQYTSVQNPKRSPKLAAVLSLAIPGAGRWYSGNPYDAKISFILTSLSAGLSYWSFLHNHPISGGLFASTTTLFWSADIYGAWRDAQLTSKK